ncbi:alpha/beta fold hydrolase [Indioceanicola profundi]|uniref:alpha/beta fold hydrolase n=1 Tax=Indioceanicola profundi TaxID=2220096 RepID=UPI000E6A9A07|nr:alpha/beta hydrolase [Indioceanicola profundi]
MFASWTAPPETIPVTPCRARSEDAIWLKDGRRLGYAVYGDPEGPPVLYFHGYPNCRREAGLLPVRDVRLIALDRPGYGMSDPRPGRTLLDWADDVAALMDALEIERAHLLGMSGGGPFAAACAYALPERIVGTALVCPLGPAGRRLGGYSPAGLLLHLGRRKRMMRLAAGVAHRVIHRGDPLNLARRLRRGFGMAYAQMDVLGGGADELIVEGWREALRQGVEGPLDDARCFASPWGFDVSAIRTPVAVWHGLADRTVPPQASRWYAANIPGARGHFIEGEGHFSLIYKYHAEILGGLLSTDRRG